MTYQASDRRSGERMMMGKMPAHTSHGSALEAAFCLRTGTHGTQRNNKRKDEQFGVHGNPERVVCGA